MQKYGFTLIEILVVIAIIAILATLAWPGILRARYNANETAAINAIKTISFGATAYRATHNTYPPDISSLSSATPPYVDTAIGAGAKNGYIFSLTGEANSYTATGRPSAYQVTGKRSFFVDESGVIRWTDQDAKPTALSPILSN